MPEPRWPDWLRRALLGSAAGAIVVVTTMEGLDRAGWTVAVLRPFEPLRNGVAPFLSMNAYGLFAVMTTDRPEIIVEGSRDGVTWLPYDFRWKPATCADGPASPRRTCRGSTGRCGSLRALATAVHSPWLDSTT